MSSSGTPNAELSPPIMPCVVGDSSDGSLPRIPRIMRCRIEPGACTMPPPGRPGTEPWPIVPVEMYLGSGRSEGPRYSPFGPYGPRFNGFGAAGYCRLFAQVFGNCAPEGMVGGRVAQAGGWRRRLIGPTGPITGRRGCGGRYGAGRW